MQHDATQFKNQHAEYSADPAGEIRLSLGLLRTNPHWKERYYEFVETMVYDNTAALAYESAIDVLEDMSGEVMSLLDCSTVEDSKREEVPVF